MIPFYAFPAEVRRIIYTTNAIEALNAKLRRAVRARGHFPTDEAALKLLFLVLNRAEKEWRMPATGVGHGQGPVRHPLRRALHHHLIIAAPHEIPDSPRPHQGLGTLGPPTIAPFAAGHNCQQVAIGPLACKLSIRTASGR